MSDLIDATGQPSGTDDGFRTMTCQVQVSVIGVEMRLDAVSVSDTGDVGNVQNEQPRYTVAVRSLSSSLMKSRARNIAANGATEPSQAYS